MSQEETYFKPPPTGVDPFLRPERVADPKPINLSPSFHGDPSSVHGALCPCTLYPERSRQLCTLKPSAYHGTASSFCDQLH
jgi:hypothetical protein